MGNKRRTRKFNEFECSNIRKEYELSFNKPGRNRIVLGLSKKYKCSITSIYNAICRAGGSFRTTAESLQSIRGPLQKKIAKEYLSGKSSIDLSKKYSCTHSTILNTLRRLRLKIRSKGQSLKIGRKNCNFSLVQEQKIIEKYKSGKNSYDIGEAYKCDPCVIQRILHRHNVKIRPPKAFGLSKTPEYSTVATHYSGIRRGLKCYKGMTFYKNWTPKKDGYYTAYKWIIKNLGRRPKGASLHIIHHDRGFVPGNLEWASRRKQANQQMFKIIAQQRHRIKYLEKRIAQLSSR